MNGLNSREMKRAIVDVLLDSVCYPDLGLAERNKPVRLLLASFYAGAADNEPKAA